MRQRLQRISKYAPSVFQARIDFAPGRSFSLTAEHPREQIVFRVLLMALLACVCAYVYFVGATVLNVIARKEASAESATLQTRVASLEGSYFAASKGITPAQGNHLGLVPITKTAYVYRPGATAAATIDRNAI